MNSESKEYYNSLLKTLDEIEANTELIGTINAPIMNTGEKTQYEKWREGSIRRVGRSELHPAALFYERYAKDTTPGNRTSQRQFS